MKNRDRINQMDDTQLAAELCHRMDAFAGSIDKHTCDICPVSNLCKTGCNGFLTWLRQEVED
jgi:radical SAM protein with 4Fe4S-binding SPASM domain